MDKNWMDLLQGTTQLSKLKETNQYTGQYGLMLSNQEAQLILNSRKNTLREQKRVEFGESIVPKIIREFCDSNYIDQSNYVTTIIRLQDIFYLYKNEMNDEITDDELLHFMREQYDLLCFGDLDYLEHTCLYEFAEAIRAGYRNYHRSDGYGEYHHFDSRERWDYELYLEALKDLFGR